LIYDQLIDRYQITRRKSKLREKQVNAIQAKGEFPMQPGQVSLTQTGPVAKYKTPPAPVHSFQRIQHSQAFTPGVGRSIEDILLYTMQTVFEFIKKRTL
jgi:hypothetical protein